ncbi:hypothetical protein TrispH2_008860 [Trichoplax sp. H2]|nr:hypothetical protein TrispH2_008860 [Trichoplax sp. H2]|eukprot:RDD39969.1 hypothetical protein TrispH2_008860 [Trichoplax sp. H2]
MTLNDTNATHVDNLLLHLLTIIITVILGGIITVISIIVNTYIICIIYKDKEMRSASFYGLMNLSFANLVVAVLYPLVPILVLITYNSPLRNSPTLKLILCGFILPLPMSAFLVINGTLTYIAIEKCYTITYRSRSRRRMQRQKVFTILMALWIVSLIQWPRSLISIEESSIHAFCRLYSSLDFIRNSLLISGTFINVTPLVITLICNARITWELKKHERFFTSRIIFRQLDVPSFHSTENSGLRFKKSIKMLRYIALVQFACCMLWLLGFHVTVSGYAAKLNPYLVGFAFILHYLCIIASGLHAPLLHIIWLKKFRRPLQICISASSSI